MSSNGFASEAVGSEREAAGSEREWIGSEREAVGSDPERVGTEPAPERVGGISVKEAAQRVGMPISTMYDWVNRRWVRTIVGLSERGKEQRLVPWSEIERLLGGAKETLIQQSRGNLDSGAGSEAVGSDPERLGGDPVPAASESAATRNEPEPSRMERALVTSGSEAAGTPSESVGIDWKWVAKAEARRVRDLSARARFLEAQLAKAETRAERAEERAEQEGRELRLLIAQSVRAQQETAAALNGIEERLALPAPKKAAWWRPWGRG
jgi:hypothetical protein